MIGKIRKRWARTVGDGDGDDDGDVKGNAEQESVFLRRGWGRDWQGVSRQA
jgi:hypothetical protein